VQEESTYQTSTTVLNTVKSSPNVVVVAAGVVEQGEAVTRMQTVRFRLAQLT